MTVLGCAIGDDTFVYAAGWRDRPTRVLGLDVGTGATIWQLQDRDLLDVPGVGKVKARLDSSAEYVAGSGILPVAFADDGGRPLGVTGLQLSTGRPVWGSRAAPRNATIMAVTESTVILVADGKQPITIAVDLTSGSTLWERDGVAGVGTSADAVVVVKPSAGALPGQGTTMVLDARTGRTRWTVRAPSSPFQIGGGYAVIEVSDEGRRQDYEILQLSTGDEINLTDAELSLVQDRSPRLVTCDPPLLRWRGCSLLKALPAGVVEEVRMPFTGFEIKAGFGRYLWGIVGLSLVALDRHGVRRTPRIEQGGVVFLDDQWLAVARDGFLVPDDFSLELYALSTA